MRHDNYDPCMDEGVFTMQDGTPYSDGLYIVYLNGCTLPILIERISGIWCNIVGLYREARASTEIRKYLGPLPKK